MKKFILLMAMMFLSTASFAADDGYDCKTEHDNIVQDLMKPVECTHDEECAYFDYGYPWQPAECIKGIVSKSKETHNISNVELIEEYNQHCIYNNKAEKKKYEEFADKLEKSSCDNMQRVYCYKGYCRMNGYAIYNDK